MKKSIHYSFIYKNFIGLCMALALVVGLGAAAHRASAADQADAKAPIVTTQALPNNGSQVTVQFPEGVSGSVTSTFDGTKWNTQTHVLTDAEQKQLQEKMTEQAKQQELAFQKFFAAQEAFWKQQDQWMASLWSGFPW